MGSPEAEVYLANACVAAAAAVAGELVDPAESCSAPMIVEGRPWSIPGDDVDTDVMYPGAYLNIDDPELMKAAPLRGLRPVAARSARRRRDPRHRRELRHRLVARARRAGDEGLGRAGGRRGELRADLPSQLRQPRVCRSFEARRGGRARPSPARASGSTPTPARSTSTARRSRRRPCLRSSRSSRAAGGLVPWDRKERAR